MKKFLSAILILLTLTACGIGEPALLVGQAEIQSVIDAAASMNSGRYVITNLATGEPQEVFSFMFTEDGTQIWLDETEYRDASTGEYVREYRYFDGTVEKSSDGSETTASYTKDEPYQMSTGVLLFFIPGLVETAVESTTDDGFTVYTWDYDAKKLREQSSALANVLTFRTTYLFDTEGNFLVMTEHITYENEPPSDYQIEIIDRNAVTEIILD
ncbi:MAG: membrane lipoprotein lipid attachment site-containing protein [Ruminococcus sp.]|jgi:hypothetical protein|nr:membrane lipoprotein lipid attachment site-containing protein [Ruminococcus sp.]